MGIHATYKSEKVEKKFNVTGLCVPSKHYMADISGKLAEIMLSVEQGEYFTINRARQYGKTTTLALLEKQLPKEYSVISVSFEGVDDSVFETPEKFCQGILNICSKYFRERNLPGSETWIDSSVTTFDLLDDFLTKTCQDKKIVLMIDEVDKVSNNFIFLKFLGMLRDKYLKRSKDIGATFQSVILAGVYDIKNLKVKLVQSGHYQLQDGEKRINSPWNIAIDFNVDMSLSEKEIASMLVEYEKDHKTGMDVEVMAGKIRTYTNGYPYLVSRLCQKIDLKLNKDWTLKGLKEAVKLILIEQSTLFDDLIKNVENNDELNEVLKRCILNGEQIPFNVDNYAIRTGLMFGIFLRKGVYVSIHNEIFELRLYNYYISQKSSQNKEKVPATLLSYVVEKGKFNMELAIKKFMQHYYELYHKSRESFLEDECRLLFLTYLRPLINGNGFYHIEAETRNLERTDVIVDFDDEQFIVELKVWKGEASHEKALEQIANYLESKNKSEGYLLTFDFRKRDNVGQPQMKWVEYKGKRIFDCMVGV
ncbi:MAG: AAA-like domain-containing protein [Fibromonadaceae bacterium]|jgi:hypothetical protein|nr:AAA-like domain-containing protein [Fibromonadaceae bacterium]